MKILNEEISHIKNLMGLITENDLHHWKGKSMDKIFKIFGYNPTKNYSSSEERKSSMLLTLNNMEKYGKIPDEIMVMAKSYYDGSGYSLAVYEHIVNNEVEFANDDVDYNTIHNEDAYGTTTLEGLRIFETPYGEYSVGTEEETKSALREYIKYHIQENVSTYPEEYILNNTDIDRLKSDIFHKYLKLFMKNPVSIYKFESLINHDKSKVPSKSQIEEVAQYIADKAVKSVYALEELRKKHSFELKHYLNLDTIENDFDRGESLSSNYEREGNVQIDGTLYCIFRQE